MIAKFTSIIVLTLLSLGTFGQSDKQPSAQIKNVDAILLFKFVPDSKFTEFYCYLNPKILIDSSIYDFKPFYFTNDDIMHDYPSIQDTIKLSPIDDFMGNACIYRAYLNNLNDQNCDSIMNLYSQNNIHDERLFKRLRNRPFELTISSEAIYQIGNSDTLCIAIQFQGKAIHYENVIYGTQSDYRISTLPNGEIVFDDSHSPCPFEKLDSNFYVVYEVMKLGKLTDEKLKQLSLVRLNIPDLKLAMYE